MKLDWQTFTAAEWYGFTPDQYATFLVFPEHDAATVWTAAKATFTNQHVICLQASSVARSVFKKRAAKTVTGEHEADRCI